MIRESEVGPTTLIELFSPMTESIPREQVSLYSQLPAGTANQEEFYDGRKVATSGNKELFVLNIDDVGGRLELHGR